MKKWFFVLFCVLLCTALTVCAQETDTAEDVDAQTMAFLMQLGEELVDAEPSTDSHMDDIYTELHWNSIADTFPEKFDLRERGTVTPIKMQNPWGTCWAFGTISAAETSILNSLHMTTDEYRETFGEDMDLSEKHLAWFAMTSLPELADYPEGAYPYDENQASEGVHLDDRSDGNIYNQGGFFPTSTAVMASGVGLVPETMVPYTDAKGTKDEDGDWSLPEEGRFVQVYELLNGNVLPVPAARDVDRNYYYRPEATEIIKSELLKGRSVGINYMADQSSPEDVMLDQMEVENLREYIREFCEELELGKDFYDVDALDKDTLLALVHSEAFGEPYEDVLKAIEDSGGYHRYMNFVDGDKQIYAQYAHDVDNSNHAVVIVGWDDTLPASYFETEGKQPPADGGWIVRNSWDTDWGMDGYFYLSYYDESITAAQTYEFITDSDNLLLTRMNILQYDYMPASILHSTLYDAPIYMANVFDVEEDSVMEYVSAVTGDLDTTLTAYIYLLDGPDSLPEEGILLTSVTQSFDYAGFHRMKLPTNLMLLEGSRIAIVVLERVNTANGVKYALVNATDQGYFIDPDTGEAADAYNVGIVNPGESYVSFIDQTWTDWAEIIEVMVESFGDEYTAYDNLPIKGYLYPLDEIMQIHQLDNWVPALAGTVATCPYDGYMLLSFYEY